MNRIAEMLTEDELTHLLAEAQNRGFDQGYEKAHMDAVLDDRSAAASELAAMTQEMGLT